VTVHRIGRRARNPFATRFIRPGMLPPLDAEGRPVSVAALAARVPRGGFMALVGPHGSGKSNLLTALATHLAHDGVVMQRRVRRARDVPGLLARIARLPVGAIACIDGWERLGAPGRLAVRVVAWCRGCDLVVTAHRPCGPVLARCMTTPSLLARLVAMLGPDEAVIGHDDVAAAYDRHAGNVREALLDLYDLFEQRIRGSAAAVRT